MQSGAAEAKQQEDKHKQRAGLKPKLRSRRRSKKDEEWAEKASRSSSMGMSSLNKCIHWSNYISFSLTLFSNPFTQPVPPPPTRHPAIAHSFTVPKYAYEYKTIRTFCGGQKLLHMTLPDKPAASAQARGNEVEKEEERRRKRGGGLASGFIFGQQPGRSCAKGRQIV